MTRADHDQLLFVRPATYIVCVGNVKRSSMHQPAMASTRIVQSIIALNARLEQLRSEYQFEKANALELHIADLHQQLLELEPLRIHDLKKHHRVQCLTNLVSSQPQQFTAQTHALIEATNAKYSYPHQTQQTAQAHKLVSQHIMCLVTNTDPPQHSMKPGHKPGSCCRT